VARTLRWSIAVMATIAAFLLAWYGLAAGWHWSRGDALGLAAVVSAVVLAPLGWWAALPIAAIDAEDRPGPGTRRDPVRFGAIPAVLPAAEPREDLLNQLRTGSGSDQVTVVHAVTGLRGVGKTQLVGEYARDRISAGWPLVAWIDAGEPVQMIGQLVALGDRLNLRLSDDEDAAVMTTRLRDWLQARSEPALLVFDNAVTPEDIACHLPATGATHVVITSTEQAFTTLGKPIAVQPFSPQQAASFLRRATGLEDLEGATSVAEELGNLPLALAQAAALISEQRLKYETYLQRLHEFPLKKYLVRPFGGPYSRGTASAILLSLTSVEDDRAASLSKPLIELLAVLASNGARRELLYLAFHEDKPPSEASGSPKTESISDFSRPHPPVREVDEAIARLARASLITSSGDGNTIQSHRLVTRVVRERAQTQQRLSATVRLALAALDHESKAAGENTWANQTVVTDLVSHATALWDHASRDNKAAEWGDKELAKDLLTLRIDALKNLLEVRDSVRALSTATSLVAACKQVLGPDDPISLQSSALLATAYLHAGRLDEAIRIRDATFTARERLLGKNSPDTIYSKSELATAYRQAGRLDQAIRLHEEAVAAADKVLGQDAPETLRFRSSLAYALRKAGRLREAISIYESIVAARGRVLGAEHRDTMRSRVSLANVYLEIGRPDEAIVIFREALTVRERVLGEDHPDTLESRNDLAIAYRRTGLVDQAIELHARNVAVREQTLGADHRDTLRSRSNLAFAYREAGRPDEAIAAFEQILAVRRQLSGDDHPDTLRVRSNLARAYQDAGKIEKGIELHKQTLTTRELVLGADHPDTLRSRHYLGSAYRQAGLANAAIPLLENAFASRNRVLGSDHPDTLQSARELSLARADSAETGKKAHIRKRITASTRRFITR
jgi:tetratricopeptide (TPR) repeat protein